MTRLYYQDSGASRLPVLQLDLISKVIHKEEELITDLPLESGRSVSDNAITQPSVFDIIAHVSNLVAEEGRPEDLPAQMWDLLKTIKAEKRFVSLVTELDTTHGLLIQELTRLEDFTTGTSLKVELTLREVRFVDVQFGEVTREKTTTQSQAQAEEEYQLTEDEQAFIQAVADGNAPAANKTTTQDLGVLSPQDIDDLPFDVFETFTEPLRTF